MEDLMKQLDEVLNSRRPLNKNTLKEKLHGGIKDDNKQWDLLQFVAVAYDAIKEDKSIARAVIYSYLEVMDIELDEAVKLTISSTLEDGFKKSDSLWDFSARIHAMDKAARQVWGKHD